MTTLNLQVAASNCDCFEDQDGATNIAEVNMNVDELDEWGGWRWTGASALDGATINSSTCQFYFQGSTFDEPDVTFWGNDVDNAAVFATAGSSSFNISGRTKTTASVAWSSTNLGLGAAGFSTSPSIASIVTEMAAGGQLASGVFVLFCTSTSGTASRDFGTNTYDNSSAQGAKWDTDYTAGGGGGGGGGLLPMMMHANQFAGGMAL